MVVKVTCLNRNRPDYGKLYVYRTLRSYVLSEKESLDQLASEYIGHQVKLPKRYIGKVIRRAKKIDIVREFQDHTMGNLWREQKVIDFDHSNKYVDGEDVAESMYQAIALAYSYVANDYRNKKL